MLALNAKHRGLDDVDDVTADGQHGFWHRTPPWCKCRSLPLPTAFYVLLCDFRWGFGRSRKRWRHGNKFKMSYDGQLLYKSGSVYNQLRLTRELSDAVITVDQVEFHIHKIILCNCSPYFGWVALISRYYWPEVGDLHHITCLGSDWSHQ